MDLTSFVSGLCGGIVGTVMSHPFDTLRVRYQNDEKIKAQNIIKYTSQLIQQEKFRTLWRGLSSPIIGIGLEKCLVFGFYDNVKKINYFNSPILNSMTAGLISGVICTSVVTPVERIKILKQDKKIITRSILTPSQLYKGWTATLVREVPGYGIYFMTYDTLKTSNILQDNYLRTPLFGAISGIMAWIFIYPSDPIKTKMQSNSEKFLEATNNIYKTYGIKGFYRGFSLAIIRAGILHAGVFMGYECVMKLLQK